MWTSQRELLVTWKEQVSVHRCARKYDGMLPKKNKNDKTARDVVHPSHARIRMSFFLHFGLLNFFVVFMMFWVCSVLSLLSFSSFIFPCHIYNVDRNSSFCWRETVVTSLSVHSFIILDFALVKRSHLLLSENRHTARKIGAQEHHPDLLDFFCSSVLLTEFRNSVATLMPHVCLFFSVPWTVSWTVLEDAAARYRLNSENWEDLMSRKQDDSNSLWAVDSGEIRLMRLSRQTLWRETRYNWQNKKKKKSNAQNVFFVIALFVIDNIISRFPSEKGAWQHTLSRIWIISLLCVLQTVFWAKSFHIFQSVFVLSRMLAFFLHKEAFRRTICILSYQSQTAWYWRIFSCSLFRVMSISFRPASEHNINLEYTHLRSLQTNSSSNSMSFVQCFVSNEWHKYCIGGSR